MNSTYGTLHNRFLSVQTTENYFSFNDWLCFERESTGSAVSFTANIGVSRDLTRADCLLSFFQLDEFEPCPSKVIPGPVDALHFVEKLIHKLADSPPRFVEIWASFSTEVVSPEASPEDEFYMRNLFFHEQKQGSTLSCSEEVFKVYTDVARFLCHVPTLVAVVDQEYDSRLKGLYEISNEDLIDHTMNDYGLRGPLPHSLDESGVSVLDSGSQE